MICHDLIGTDDVCADGGHHHRHHGRLPAAQLHRPPQPARRASPAPALLVSMPATLTHKNTSSSVA